MVVLHLTCVAMLFQACHNPVEAYMRGSLSRTNEVSHQIEKRTSPTSRILKDADKDRIEEDDADSKAPTGFPSSVPSLNPWDSSPINAIERSPSESNSAATTEAPSLSSSYVLSAIPSASNTTADLLDMDSDNHSSTSTVDVRDESGWEELDDTGIFNETENLFSNDTWWNETLDSFGTVLTKAPLFFPSDVPSEAPSASNSNVASLVVVSDDNNPTFGVNEEGVVSEEWNEIDVFNETDFTLLNDTLWNETEDNVDLPMEELSTANPTDTLTAKATMVPNATATTTTSAQTDPSTNKPDFLRCAWRFLSGKSCNFSEKPFTSVNDTLWNETEDVVDLPMEELSTANSTKVPSATATIAPNVTTTASASAQTEIYTNKSDLLPCAWRFLTGEFCTADLYGDVVNATHHEHVISDGNCNHNDFLGYYRARCEGSTESDPARIYLQDVFCSDDTCGSCLRNGVVQPEVYPTHACKHVHYPVAESRDVPYDFAFEFVGGCYEIEVCSRVTIAGRGSH